MSEYKEQFTVEGDVNADVAGLHRLASELSPADALQAYRGMLHRYVETGQPGLARELKDQTTELWKNLSAEERKTLVEIEEIVEA